MICNDRDNLAHTLRTKLSDIYCYNCAYEENDYVCEDCHRKYMNWAPSTDFCEKLADLILEGLGYEEN